MRTRSTTRPSCGTDSGYFAHRWRSEVTCDECCRAHAEAERTRWRSRRDAKQMSEATS